MNEESEKLQVFIQLVDDYIEGNSNNSQKQRISQMMEENPFFKDVLKQQVEARSNIRVAGEAELKKKFSARFDPIAEEVNSGSKFPKRLLVLLLLLGFIGGGYYHLSQQHSDRHPAEKTISKTILQLAQVEDPSFDILRSQGNSDLGALWQSVVKRFSNKDYIGVLDLVLDLESNIKFAEENQGMLSLIRGVSELKLKEYANSESTLSGIPMDNPYSDQAEWYLALTSYYAGEKVKAKERLNEIHKNGNHFKSSEARHYLKLLE